MTDTTITTLPLQKDVDIFLRMFFAEKPEGSFYLTDLTIEVVGFFGVTPDDAALQYEHTHKQTCEDTSRIEQLTNWGCVHLLADKTIKRTGPNEYQNRAGGKREYFGKENGEPKYEVRPGDLFNEALAFMRHARKLEFSLGQAKTMYGERWDAAILDRAAEEAFA